MKYAKLTILILFAVIFTAAAVHADVRTAVNSVDPQPVEPGNDLTLKIGYTNFGATQVHMFSALDITYPFSLKSSTESFENGFDVCGFCSRTNNYFISVDPSAKSGIYPIYIRLTDVNGGQEVKTINVSVRGTPNLILVTEPIANVTPSNKFDVNLEVRNIGTGLAREVKIVTKSTDFVALGATIQTVNNVDAKDSAMILFSMSTNNDVAAGSYNIPFEISYKDEQGNLYTVDQNIGVRVVNDGLLSVQSLKIADTSSGGDPVAGNPVTIVIRLQNVGHGDVNYIESVIACDGTSAKAFLGQLKKDEDAPAVFDITIAHGGTFSCTANTKYLDDLGEHTLQTSFDMTVKNQSFPIIIPIIIVLAVGFYLYRKRKKK